MYPPVRSGRISVVQKAQQKTSHTAVVSYINEEVCHTCCLEVIEGRNNIGRPEGGCPEDCDAPSRGEEGECPGRLSATADSMHQDPGDHFIGHEGSC